MLDDETLENWVWGKAPQRGVVAFLKAPSIGVVYLVTKTGKWALLEPGRTLKLNLVQRHIFTMCEDLACLFLEDAICRGSLFSGQSAKMGADGARSHVGGSNLVQRHIFSMCEDWGGLFLDGTIYRDSLFSG